MSRCCEKSVTEIFGINVFNDSVMKQRLPKDTYRALKRTIDEGAKLTLGIAEVVANAMKDWAIERGATHYTHWFQPMTGMTAGKHDSFISLTDDGRAIMEFSGKALIKGEPDASSFPSGGLRATFEARGYTAWDCTSPAFLKADTAGNVTLCIPTAFCSYTGEALDTKTPLLRSMEALSKQAMRVLRLFGNQTAKRVITTVGAEQEYFLVDRSLYQQRKDLIFAGRSLFGAMPPKGQELEDHYFGNIPDRISAFMAELDYELWKLGVSAKTKHNETAPAQYEIAPIFTTGNVAADHNQLVMETLKNVAHRHNLACLLHEKPFAGMNGSGKHNNWSMCTNDGQNLLDPGTTPHENAQFLVFLVAVIQAVDEYAEILRMFASNPGNDHRLGANEAPPAIISIFLGEQLTDILEQFQNGKAKECKQYGELKIGVSTLPTFPKDATDRNRTSPFAFTGNRFEFRMVPSSASISGANIVLNTVVAETLSIMADRLEQAENFHNEVQQILKEVIRNHRRIIFNGNGYTEEWVEEAQRRGLPYIKNTVAAIPHLISEKSIDVFTKHGVYSKTELYARYEIALEDYINQIHIEASTMIQMAKRQIIPATIAYTTNLAHSINEINQVSGVSSKTATKILAEATELLDQFDEALEILENCLKESSQDLENHYEQACYYRDYVFVAMEKVRSIGDQLETVVDGSLWPFPTYSELLFHV